MARDFLEDVEFKGKAVGIAPTADLELATKKYVDDKEVLGVVVHGSTAGTARPSGFASTTWIGTVEPTNAIDDDIWVDQSGGGGGVVDNFRQIYRVFEDFTNASATSLSIGDLGWTRTVNGTVANLTKPNPTAQNEVGLISATTGTTAGGRATVSLGTALLYFGGGETEYEWRAKVATLSDETNTFVFYCGLGSNAGAGDMGNGVYFEYRQTSSPNWRYKTATNNTRSDGTSSVAVVANTWYRLKAVVNATGSSVEFFIDDVSVGTLTSNIPTASNRLSAPLMKIEKTVGTTARTAQADYFYLSRAFTTHR
jgi:hypothetical protein